MGAARIGAARIGAAPRCVLVLAALLLGACAGRAPRATLPPLEAAPAVHQAQREAMLATRGDWSLQGRVALSNGRDGGSGRIDWQQRGERYTVGLSAPITRQSWRLSGDTGGARIEGLDGGPREDTDPARLLREATRWEIPVAALADWVRGVPAPVAGHGPAQVDFGPDGRVAGIEQDGWGIRYAAWTLVDGIELPVRLDARRGEASVRLVVDAWILGGPLERVPDEVGPEGGSGAGSP